MNQNLILLPVFLQVLLTLAVMVVMGSRRRSALVSKKTTMKDVALGQDAWPADATKASNNFKNQFETPVLFFAAAAFALITKSIDIWMLGLAWVYVITRIGHAAVHLGGNIVMQRASLYLAGVVALLAMWVMIVVRAVGPIL